MGTPGTDKTTLAMVTQAISPLSDPLGSTSVTASSSGVEYGEVRDKPWGEDRYTEGATPTSLRFTGQRQQGST